MHIKSEQKKEIIFLPGEETIILCYATCINKINYEMVFSVQ